MFRTSADIVTIDAVVTDSDGRHVTDLTAADFEVTVSGKKQDLQQAVYVRTADQPQVLAAAAGGSLAGRVRRPAPGRSEASTALKRTGPQPDRMARTIALVVDDLGLSFRSTVDVRDGPAQVHRHADAARRPRRDRAHGGGRRHAPAVHDRQAPAARGGRPGAAGTSRAGAGWRPSTRPRRRVRPGRVDDRAHRRPARRDGVGRLARRARLHRPRRGGTAGPQVHRVLLRGLCLDVRGSRRERPDLAGDVAHARAGATPQAWSCTRSTGAGSRPVD